MGFFIDLPCLHDWQQALQGAFLGILWFVWTDSQLWKRRSLPLGKIPYWWWHGVTDRCHSFYHHYGLYQVMCAAQTNHSQCMMHWRSTSPSKLAFFRRPLRWWFGLTLSVLWMLKLELVGFRNLWVDLVIVSLCKYDKGSFYKTYSDQARSQPFVLKGPRPSLPNRRH